MDPETQRLADYIAIRELTARYNRAFDDGDAEAFARNFTEDGVMEVPGLMEVKGREGLEQMCRSTPYGVVHVTTDSIIDIDGDRAVQDVTVMVLQRPKPGSAAAERQSTLQQSGRYRDELVRTPDGWRFARRTANLDGF